MSQGLRVLVLDPDPVSGQQVAMTLDAAGLSPQACPFEPRALIETLRSFDPQVLWVKAELGSDSLGRLLATLERQMHYAQLPIVLLCQEVKEAPFVRQMKTGVVELLQGPFSPRLHVARLRLLPRELPERRGQLRGSGTGRDLQGLLEHVIRAHRTGALNVNEGSPNEGRAFFVKGVLQNAWFGSQQGPTALAAMGALSQASWIFNEGADGAGMIFEWDALSAAQDESLDHPEKSVAKAAALPPPVKVARSLPQADELPPELQPGPTSAAPAGYEQVAAAMGVPTVDAAPDSSGAPILFVDDDPALAKMFQAYFSKKGYPAETAGDGVEAFQKLLAKHFEIVIADLNMPRLDGWGLLRALREDARTQETPVALFSCHDDYRESLRAVHAGAQAYYPKTLRMNALEVQVRELLEPRRRFERLVSGRQSVTTNLSALGAQWVLRLIARLGVTGRLDATDAWATFRLHFTHGQLTHAVARVESQLLTPDAALTAFISGRGIEGSMAYASDPAPQSFSGRTTEDLLAWMCEHLNDVKKRAREEARVGAKALDVDPDLYQLYASVGPPQYRAIAQLLCELKLLPRDVMTRLNVSAQEVAVVVNDLILRGVAHLR